MNPPTWRRWRELPRVVAHRPHLKRTLLTAAVVGTILLFINHFDVLLAGQATTRLWIKAAFTYVVPFVVSNVGILIATRR